MELINYIIPFIVLITVVVFIHEYGHYYFAKRYGVGITDFSIGFGNEIFGWNDKSGTRWKVCWIPLGGYVKFFGDRNVFSQSEQKELIDKYKDEDKEVKTIAGKFQNAEGPIKEHNVEPIYFDIELKKGKEFHFKLPTTHNSFVYLVDGEIIIGEKKHDFVKGSTLILLTKGEELKIKSKSNSKFLLISGKPINEEIARGGPFVMNTKSEILEAINDYHNGTFVK